MAVRTKATKKQSVLKNYKFNNSLEDVLQGKRARQAFKKALEGIPFTIQNIETRGSLKKLFNNRTGGVVVPYSQRNTLKPLLKDVNSNLFNGKDYIRLYVGETAYTISTEDTRDRVLNLLQSDFETTSSSFASDEELLSTWKTADNITVEFGKFEKGSKTGAYFSRSFKSYYKKHFEKFASLTQINIQDDRFAIDLKKKKKENCFIHSIKTFCKINKMKIHPDFYETYHDFTIVGLKGLNDVCNDFNIRISVKEYGYYNSRKNVLRTYGNKNNCDEVIKIALLDGHFIPVVPSGLTSFFINNFDALKNEPNPALIYKMGSRGGFDRDFKNKRTINTDQALDLLMKQENKFFIDNCNLHTTDNFTREDEFDCDEMELCNSKGEERTYFRPEKRDEYINVYADTETYTDDDGMIKPFMCSFYTKEEGKVFRFTGKDCCVEMLDYLIKTFGKQRVKLIFHNLKFDLSVMLGGENDNFTRVDVVDRGGMIICGGFTYKNKRFYLQDSMSYLPMKLSKFSDFFNLPEEKGVLPYKYYTKETVFKNERVSLEEFIKIIKLETYDMIKINQAVEKARALMGNDGLIDMIEYCGVYCNEDVILLERGLSAFSNIIKENIFNIDVDKLLDEFRTTFINPEEDEAVEMIEEKRLDLEDFKGCDLLRDFRTISSLGDTLLKIKGGYHRVYNVTGTTRKFISRAMYGGRVQSRFNKKYHIKRLLNDFDAVSLYPSAMYRMEGFLMGRPKILQSHQLNKQFLDQQDGYFVEIKINKVNKKRGFSVAGLKLEDRRLYDDNALEGSYIVVDKTTLEMLIKYNKIEYEIKQGYFYDDGRNNKVREVIKSLFDLRLEAKANGNKGLQETYKLMMNSCYGKTGLKAEDYKTGYLKQEDFDRLMRKKGAFIFKYEKLDNGFIKYQQIKNVLHHTNAIHINCEILSMSKVIMNEVMYLAEDNNINIYYTDTDSIHIEDKDIKRLGDLFQEQYGRPLIGKQLGQFHTDFSSDKLRGELVAIETIILGAKCYIDKLTSRENLDVDNKVIDEELIDHHIRMKGCNLGAIKAKNEGDVMKTFKQMLKNETVRMNLNDDKNHFSCKTSNLKAVKSIIKRNIVFDAPSYSLVGNKTLTVITPLNDEKKYNLKQERIKKNLQAIRRQ